MFTFAVWSLVIGFVPVSGSTNSSSCDMTLWPLWIGSCKEVPGPVVNCSEQLSNHINIIKELREQFLQVNINGDITYNDLKLTTLAQWQFFTATDNLFYFIRETFSQHSNVENETCIATVVLEEWTHRNDSTKYMDYFNWIDCYFPIFGGLEFISAMVGNLLIVMIYIRKQDMKTEPNKVIFNLAVADIILTNNILATYIIHRWAPLKKFETFCPIVQYLRSVSITGAIYSMVVLSLLRYLVTVSAPQSRTQRFIKKRTLIPILLLLVWVLAAIVGIPEAFATDKLCGFRDEPVLAYLRLVCLCVLPLFFIAAFSVATSRILYRDIPGEQTSAMIHEMHSRHTGAKVILSLVIVFCVTHFPVNIFYLFRYPDRVHSNFIVFLLIGLNSSLNPVALFIGSSKFRKHLNCYISKCSCNNLGACIYWLYSLGANSRNT